MDSASDGHALIYNRRRTSISVYTDVPLRLGSVYNANQGISQVYKQMLSIMCCLG